MQVPLLKTKLFYHQHNFIALVPKKELVRERLTSDMHDFLQYGSVPLSVLKVVEVTGLF